MAFPLQLIPRSFCEASCLFFKPMERLNHVTGISVFDEFIISAQGTYVSHFRWALIEMLKNSAKYRYLHENHAIDRIDI